MKWKGEIVRRQQGSGQREEKAGQYKKLAPRTESKGGEVVARSGRKAEQGIMCCAQVWDLWQHLPRNPLTTCTNKGGRKREKGKEKQAKREPVPRKATP